MAFSPLVFSAAGGIGTTATVYKSFGIHIGRQTIQQNDTLAEMQAQLLYAEICHHVYTFRAHNLPSPQCLLHKSAESINLALHEGQVPSFCMIFS